MNLNIVSLKSIYKLLTDNDYPSASYPIFSKANLKGLTLSSFWNRVMLEEFRAGRYGQIIFRTEGARNRFFSQMCNRDKGIGFYADYAEELDELIKTEFLIRQVTEIATFLKNRDFNYEVLENKLKDFVKFTYDHDDVYNCGIVRLLNKIFDHDINISSEDIIVKANHCGLLLTILIFMSLYGYELNNNGRGHSLEASIVEAINKYNRRLQENKLDTSKRDTLVYTNKKSSLWNPTVDPECFYGRESELFEINEFAHYSGRYLISGVDGIGKSELLKQLLWKLNKTQDIDAIGTVSFKGNIRESVVEAFRGIDIENLCPGIDPELDTVDKIFEVLLRLQMKKTVLIIDEVDRNFVNDPLFDRLSELQISIIVASKLSRIRGFRKINIDLLHVKSCYTIFKSVTGLRFTQEQALRLLEVFQNPRWRHTQNLVFLAKIIKKQGWDQDTVLAKIENFNVGMNTTILHRMFALTDVNELGKRIMRFLSWIPFDSIELDFMLESIDTSGYSDEDIKNVIEKLEDYGWIIYKDLCVTPQPFICDCIRKISDIDRGLNTFISRLKNAWIQDVSSSKKLICKAEEFAENASDKNHINKALLYMFYIEKRSGELVDVDEAWLLLLSGEVISGLGYRISDKCIRILKSFIEDTRATQLFRFLCYDVLLTTSCDINDFTEYAELFDAEMSNDNSEIPVSLLCRAALKSSYSLISRGLFGDIEKRCNWVREHSDKPLYSESAKYLMALYYYCICRHDMAEACCPKDGLYNDRSILNGMSNAIMGLNAMRRHDWTTINSIIERMKMNKHSTGKVFEGYRLWMNSLADLQNGDLDSGIEGLYKARRIISAYRGSDNIEIIFMTEFIAVSYLWSGRFDAAESLLLEIRSNCEKYPELVNVDAEVCILLIIIYLKSDRLPDAYELLEYTNAIVTPELYPIYYENLFLQAKVSEKQGCLEKALKLAEEAYGPLAEYYGVNDKTIIEVRNFIQSLR